jgi:hypothetical protein
VALTATLTAGCPTAASEVSGEGDIVP